MVIFAAVDLGDLMGRVLNRLGVVLATVTLAITGVSAPACACSCLPTTEKQAYSAADAVFVGTVVRRHGPRHPQSSADAVRLTLAVHAVYKGFVRPRQRIRTAYSSASCGIEAQVGERYLIFATTASLHGAAARGPAIDGPLAASLCGGTRPATGVPREVGGHPPIRTWPV